MSAEPPEKLYKYRPFDSTSLRLLCESETWYSTPSAFNDPLEGLPEVINDIDRLQLEELHDYVHPNDGQAVRYRHSWSWTEDGDDYRVSVEEYQRRIEDDIRDNLAKALDGRGILTLSKRWDSPLMWSHYADSHKGFCIEYDATDRRCKFLRPVRYDSPRGIRLSDLYRWKVRKEMEGLEGVVASAFLCKAPDWEYEEEWRDVSRAKGVHSAPFGVCGIVFGLRCPSQVRTAIMLIYSRNGDGPGFYEAYFDRASFRMLKRRVDPYESAYIRPSAAMAFGEHQDLQEHPFLVDE